MNVFPDTLRLIDAGMRDGSRIFCTETPFRYFSSYGLIVVPFGTETDGASIPRCFWNIFDPFSDYFPAAVLHDYLYSPANREFSRGESDEIFKEAMYNVGVPWYRREIIYNAVRLFGRRCFRGRPPKTF